jgi:serine protease
MALRTFGPRRACGAGASPVWSGLGRAMAAACLLVMPWQAVQALPATNPAHDDTANGVIVQLEGATAHVSAQRRSAPELSKALGDERRYATVVAAALGAAQVSTLASKTTASVRLRPVGASAALVHFDRRLSVAEAAHLSEQLAAQPGVRWAVPNSREGLHQAPASVPRPLPNARLDGASGLTLGVGALGQAISLNPPNDPLFSGAEQQWWLQPAGGSDANGIERRLRGVPGIQSAWQHQTQAVTVAVLDTGITAHPELEGRILPGWDFVSDWDPASAKGYAADGGGRDNDARDPGDGVTQADRDADPGRYARCPLRASSWHGTIIAGMLSGQTDNARGVAGLAWQGQVVPVRVAGRCGADVADVIDGLRWAAGLPVAGVPPNAHPARIINMSFGGDAPCNAAYQQALRDIAQAPGGGAVLVASAGNRWGTPSRPSNCPGVVGVTALNRDGFKANYASFGSTVSLATVGGDDRDGAWAPWLADSGLLTLTNAGQREPGAPGYTRVYGTSFAAPLVSGVAALMLAVNPALTAAQVKTGLALSARPHVTSPYLPMCTDKHPGRCACTTLSCGAGLLDAEQAVLFARNPDAYVAPATQPAQLDSAELRAAAASGPDRPANTLGVEVASETAAAAPASGGHTGWLFSLALALAAWSLGVTREPRNPREPHRSS